MGRATLEYHVRDLSINLFSDLLFNIDKYTSEMKDEKELFDKFLCISLCEDKVQSKGKQKNLQQYYAHHN